MLFFDDKMRQWNANEIRSISTARKVGDRWVHDVTFKDGEAVTVSDTTWHSIQRTISHVLPTSGDYFAITGESDGEIFAEAVLGWAVTMDGSVMPLTVDGLNGGIEESVPIIRPTGEVQVPDSSTYRSVDEYIASLKKVA